MTSLTRRDFLLLGAVTTCAGMMRPSTARASQCYFAPAVHQAILEDPTQIGAIYADERARFVHDCGLLYYPEIEEHRRLGFCALLAYDLKPYGPASPCELTELLAAPSLSCCGYVLLAWRLFLLLQPQPTTTVTAGGWRGGFQRSHCQLFAHKAPDAYGEFGGDWLVDPSTGLLLCGHDFNFIASGHAINFAYLRDFYWRGDIDEFRWRVRVALHDGLYRPSDLLYYVSDLDRFARPSPVETWMTPQADAVLEG